MYKKAYVEVTAKFTADGRIIPLKILWDDGKIYNIDRVTDVRRAASLKVGGAGIRYTCRIGGKEGFLFLEENRWFAQKIYD